MLFKLMAVNLLLFCLAGGGICAESNSVTQKSAKNRYQFVHKEFRMRFSPRTPQQIHAFYEARGFSREALMTLRDKCFFTVGLKNTGKNIILSDVANWQFSAAGKPVRLYTRAEWKAHWSALHVPLGKQATFRWTQFPIKLDFRPDEGEAGNVVVTRSRDKLTFKATFIIENKETKQQTPVNVTVENLQCAFD